MELFIATLLIIIVVTGSTAFIVEEIRKYGELIPLGFNAAIAEIDKRSVSLSDIRAAVTDAGGSNDLEVEHK